MSAESITRRELQKLYKDVVSIYIKKFERKNADKTKIELEFTNLSDYESKLKHILCLNLIAKHLNKSIEEMLEYNIMLINKDTNDFKVFDRVGNVIIKYHIDDFLNHIYVDDKDIGEISISSVL